MTKISLLRYLSAFVIVCTILILTLIDSISLTRRYTQIGELFFFDQHFISKHFEQISNYGHTFAAFILTLLTLPLLKRPFLIAIPALIVFVVASEGLQYFSPTRVSNLDDVFYNLIGIAVATALFFIFKKTLSPPKAP